MSSPAPSRRALDLTAEKAYTLSAGTRHILAKLDSPVTLRYYCSQAEMPPELKPYAQEIEDLLGEYQQAGKGKIILEKYDPKPDSDAEDSARLNGVQGEPLELGGSDRIYLGLSVSRLDYKVAIPTWLDLARDPVPRTAARIRNLPRHQPRHQSRTRHHRHHERPARHGRRAESHDAAHGPAGPATRRLCLRTQKEISTSRKFP